MKRYLFLMLVVLFYFAACSPSKNLDSDFNKCLKIVSDYDNTCHGTTDDTTLARFYFAIEYLGRITNIEANIISYDVPYYDKRSDCKSDLRKWRKWYDENMDYLTQERSDSLKHEIAKDNIWWSDSTILQYVFEIE